RRRLRPVASPANRRPGPSRRSPESVYPARTGSFVPNLPRRLAAVPEVVERLVFAIGVHCKEEALVAVDHQLSLVADLLQGFALEDAGVAVEVVEDAVVEDEEAGAGPSLGLRLLREVDDAVGAVDLEDAEAGVGADAGDGRQAAM